MTFLSTCHDSNNFFSRKNISLLSGKFPKNFIPHVMIEWKYERCTNFNISLSSVSTRDLIEKPVVPNFGKMSSVLLFPFR
jgi:hypothetical protein